MNRPQKITRTLVAVLGIAALGGTVAVATGGSSQAAPTVGVKAAAVPPLLAVPAGNKAIADFAAQGVQVYQCTAGAWAFVEPAAALIGRTAGPSRTYQTAVHFRGPSWESTVDGSLVTAAAVTGANIPVPGSIPQLLLKATSNRGDGLFGTVTYIQRLDTTGGAAPAGTCTNGKTTGVPYTAKYRFFAAG